MVIKGETHIDISEATGEEIINVIQSYPNGRLELNDNRAYWYIQAMPTNQQPAPLHYGGGQVAQRPQGNQLNQAANRMLDNMAGIFGQPGAR